MDTAMIDTVCMIKNFFKLSAIDSEPLFEREMADAIKAILHSAGLDVYEDDAGKKTGGNSGNLICTLKGDSGKPALLVSAHMDTIVPGKNKKAVLDGDVIRTDGTTILGADDIAGIVYMLEAIRVIQCKSLAHGDLHFVFTIAEEGGLFGSTNLDYSVIDAKYGFVVDYGSDIGRVVVKAPFRSDIDAAVTGVSAHAGKPEKGINAIKIVSEAISDMKIGRVDPETTSNIGVIRGGNMSTTICSRVELTGEVRSFSEEKLNLQTLLMRECLEKAAGKYGGGFEFDCRHIYNAYDVESETVLMTHLQKVYDRSGVVLIKEYSCSGSDANIYNEKGIKSVVLATGAQYIHSTSERIKVSDLTKGAELLVQLLSDFP
jgi:tripeptide aminopeptidase